jgi:hypothetical protein
MPACLLCHSTSTERHPEDNSAIFYRCKQCGSVYKHNNSFLSQYEEKERYLLHENDVNDPDYRAFVAPVVNRVLTDFKTHQTGLDFGAGTGPVISTILSEKGYLINLYDPFFHPDTAVLNTLYDFIVCCEVIEHFHTPAIEFKRLKNLLKSGGKLYCMTHLLPGEQNFANWYYKDDPTHVIFYSEKNLKWIKNTIGFSHLEIDGRLIVFTR